MINKIEHIATNTATINDGTGQQGDHRTAAAERARQEEKARIREVVSSLNKMMESANTKLSFTVDNRLKKAIVKVVDAETNRVIRQIPSEEALKIAQNVQNMMGILYDASA